MRHTCDARLIMTDDGKVIYAMVLAVGCIAGFDDGCVRCDKPAVEEYESMRLSADESMPIRERLTDIQVYLCAEHWDQREREMKEIEEDEPGKY